MRRAWLKGLLGVLAVSGVVLQLLPARPRDNPPVESEPAFPPEVARAVRRSCYDCHSNLTRWPWYSQVAPLSWSISEEVAAARERLNFTRWHSYSVRRQRRLLESSLEMARQHHMPPWRYRPLHPGAGLTTGELAALRRWMAGERFAPVLVSSGTIEGGEGSSLRLPRLKWSSFELPSRAWSDQRHLAGSWRAERLTGSLQLDQALILVTGDVDLEELQGSGALVALGRVRLGRVQGSGLAILARRDVEIGGGELEGLVYSEGDVTLRDLRLKGRAVANGSASRLRLERVRVEEGQAFLKFPVEGLHERSFSYCRDDGQIGELERAAHFFYGHGRYVLLDPEFETSREATTLDQALEAAESLLAQDPATELGIWRARYRASWKEALERLPDAPPAHFEYHLGEAVPR